MMNNTKPGPRMTAFILHMDRFLNHHSQVCCYFHEQNKNCCFFFCFFLLFYNATKGAGCPSANNQLDFPEPEGPCVFNFLGPEHGFKMHLCCLNQMNSQFKWWSWIFKNHIKNWCWIMKNPLPKIVASSTDVFSRTVERLATPFSKLIAGKKKTVSSSTKTVVEKQAKLIAQVLEHVAQWQPACPLPRVRRHSCSGGFSPGASVSPTYINTL